MGPYQTYFSLHFFRILYRKLAILRPEITPMGVLIKRKPQTRIKIHRKKRAESGTEGAGYQWAAGAGNQWAAGAGEMGSSQRSRKGVHKKQWGMVCRWCTCRKSHYSLLQQDKQTKHIFGQTQGGNTRGKYVVVVVKYHQKGTYRKTKTEVVKYQTAEMFLFFARIFLIIIFLCFINRTS